MAVPLNLFFGNGQKAAPGEDRLVVIINEHIKARHRFDIEGSISTSRVENGTIVKVRMQGV
jgi:hypothetical protein